jgi:DinB superfamily
MLDFARVRAKERTIQELAEGLTRDDLRHTTNEMVEIELNLMMGCTDADVTFLPEDSEADDSFAATPDEVKIAWTLAHVIVHVTASAEEAAFVAAEMARGVPQREGRSRFEVPWRSVVTIAQCQQRLEESRRMRLATLDVWPDEPHLDNLFRWRPNGPAYNPVARFLQGLNHEHSHLAQITEIVRQAKAAQINT